jgi:uncharacterized protein YndB with AHSA1/START domain
VWAPLEHAFQVFTEGLDKWWDSSHHLGPSERRQALLEGREGGRLYEIGVDGSECDWGRVLAWEPPHRLLLAWQIDGSWQFDPNLVTEVEVLFKALGPAVTRVEVEHRDFERFGADSAQMRASLGGSSGWQSLLDVFAQQAAG